MSSTLHQPLLLEDIYSWACTTKEKQNESRGDKLTWILCVWLRWSCILPHRVSVQMSSEETGGMSVRCGRIWMSEIEFPFLAVGQCWVVVGEWQWIVLSSYLPTCLRNHSSWCSVMGIYVRLFWGLSETLAAKDTREILHIKLQLCQAPPNAAAARAVAAYDNNPRF